MLRLLRIILPIYIMTLCGCVTETQGIIKTYNPRIEKIEIWAYDLYNSYDIIYLNKKVVSIFRKSIVVPNEVKSSIESIAKWAENNNFSGGNYESSHIEISYLNNIIFTTTSIIKVPLEGEVKSICSNFTFSDNRVSYHNNIYRPDARKNMSFDLVGENRVHWLGQEFKLLGHHKIFTIDFDISAKKKAIQLNFTLDKDITFKTSSNQEVTDDNRTIHISDSSKEIVRIKLTYKNSDGELETGTEKFDS